MSKNIDYDKIYTYLQNDVSAKLRGSLAILLSNYIESSSENYWNCQCSEPEQLKYIRIEIAKSIAELSTVITEYEENIQIKDDYFHKYIEHKETMSDIQKSLKQCLYKANFYKHILKNVFYNFEATHIEEFDINSHKIITDCIAFFEDSHSEEEKRYKISSIMSCMPIKMARIKYFDYIRNGIELLSKEEPQFCFDYIENVEDIFSSCLYTWSGSSHSNQPAIVTNEISFFKEIDEDLRKFKDIEFENLNFEEVKGFLAEIEEIIAHIAKISDYLLLVFESINSLLTIYTFVNDMGYLFSDDFSYKDAYYYIKETIEGKEKDGEYISENIVSILEKYLDKTMEEIHQLMLKNKGYLEKLDFERTPENLNDMININAAVTHLFYENINDIVSKKEKEKISVPDRNVLHERVEKFISFIEESLKAEKPKIQRQLKQFFIGFLVMPLGDKQFADYMEDTISSVTDPIQKKAIIIHLHEMFEKFGHYPSDGFANDEPDQHEHDCDCGHGHDHDCGHAHHI